MNRERAAAWVQAAWVAALCMAPAVSAALTPAAIDFSGDGHVQDSLAFGLYGAAVEVTVWGSSGIVAGPAAVSAGAQGSYAWAFSQVPQGSLLNITVRVWLPWDPNLTASRVFPISNGTPQTAYPGEDFALPFTGIEQVARTAPPAGVSLARGMNVTVPFALQNTGNVSVGRAGMQATVNVPNVTVQLSSPAAPDEQWPGGAFTGNLTLGASAGAPPGPATLNLTVPSLSGSNFTVAIPLNITLNHDAAVLSVATAPAPLRENEAGNLVVRVENRGNDTASQAEVRVRVFNATIPTLYSNLTRQDLAPGGPLDVSFAWAAPWSPAPYDVFASVFVPDDLNTSDNAQTVQIQIESTNAAPSVNFSAPAQDARVAGSVTVAGSTNDPEGSGVNTSFSVDGGAPFLELPGVSFAFVWDLSALADGPHSLVATGRDERGDTSNATLRVVVLNRGPNAPPTLVVASPENGETVGEVASFAGTAADERGELAAVYVEVDGGPAQGASGTSNWSYSWNTSAFTEGPHTVRFWAWDGIDPSAVATVNITVNRSAPAGVTFAGIAVTPPSPQPSQTVHIAGQAQFDTGVFVAGAQVSVSFRGFANVVNAIADARGRFSVDIAAPSTEGNYTLDIAGRSGNVSGSASRSVLVAFGAAPDLQVVPGSFTWNPDPPTSNTTIHHTVTIENSGDLSATATLRVFDVTGGTPALLFERAFTVSTRFDASFTATYTEGKHNLSIRVEDVSPADANVSNNNLEASLTVLAVPDLAVVSITPSLITPLPGQNITLLVLVTNVGQVAGSASVEVWDGVPLATGSVLLHQEFVGVVPGAQERVLGVWTARLGNSTLYVSIVLTNPPETNISNNHANITISVPPQPPVVEKPFLPGFEAPLAAAALAAGLFTRLRRGPARGRKDRRGTSTTTRAALIMVLAAALALAALPPAALGGLSDARLVPGPLNGVCQTCHTDPNGGGALNSFGIDYAAAKNASAGNVNWSALGAKDSDGDGYSNEQEWNGSYLPGDAHSNPATGVKYGGFGGAEITSVVTGALALFALSLFGVYMGFRMLRKRNARVAKKEAEAAQQRPPPGPP